MLQQQTHDMRRFELILVHVGIVNECMGLIILLLLHIIILIILKMHKLYIIKYYIIQFLAIIDADCLT